MNAYNPRRASARFLDGDCPAGVLAIFDNPESFDRYTVIYAEPVTNHRGDVWLWYRGMSTDPTHPQGFGVAGEMTRWEMATYRRRNYRRSCRWSELPAAVQAVVRRDVAEVTA